MVWSSRWGTTSFIFKLQVGEMRLYTFSESSEGAKARESERNYGGCTRLLNNKTIEV